MSEFVQHLINGLSLGGTYALLALGLALVFTILHLVNFAHGELITIPGYALLALHYLGAPWVVMAIAAPLVGMLAALTMERVAFRPVRSATPTTMLLTSFGLSIILQALFVMLVSPRPRAVPQPDWFGSSVIVGGVRLQALQLLTVAVVVVTLVALSLLLRRTLLGVTMRAAAEDFDAARLMGVRANGVIATAFAVSGLLAGLAAVLVLARRGSVNPMMGLGPVLNAFVANVIGGIGNLWGAAAGGLLLGAVEVALRALMPPTLAGMVDGFVFALVAVILLVKPSGLFSAETAVRV